MTIYVSIGNSDDKLTQQEYSDFVRRVDAVIREVADAVHGQWFSASNSRWQNACWCFEISDDFEAEDDLRQYLAHLAWEYKQDSIAWAQASTTFIEPMQWLTPTPPKPDPNL